MSVHSTRFFSLAQGVFELSSSLENPLDYGRLTLIVILIKMSYVGLRLGSLVGLVVGLVDVFLELTIELRLTLMMKRIIIISTRLV